MDGRRIFKFLRRQEPCLFAFGIEGKEAFKRGFRKVQLAFEHSNFSLAGSNGYNF